VPAKTPVTLKPTIVTAARAAGGVGWVGGAELPQAISVSKNAAGISLFI